MKPVSAKLENLLREKLDLLRRMDVVLSENIAMLSEDTLDDLSSKINLNDQAISAIKNIDYEIARIEASEGREAGEISKVAGSLMDGITEISRRTESKLVELIERLGELRDKTRTGLENAVRGGQISGYKPGRNGKAIYVDKRK